MYCCFFLSRGPDQHRLVCYSFAQKKSIGSSFIHLFQRIDEFVTDVDVDAVFKPRGHRRNDDLLESRIGPDQYVLVVLRVDRPDDRSSLGDLSRARNGRDVWSDGAAWWWGRPVGNAQRRLDRHRRGLPCYGGDEGVACRWTPQSDVFFGRELENEIRFFLKKN